MKMHNAFYPFYRKTDRFAKGAVHQRETASVAQTKRFNDLPKNFDGNQLRWGGVLKTVHYELNQKCTSICDQFKDEDTHIQIKSFQAAVLNIRGKVVLWPDLIVYFLNLQLLITKNREFYDFLIDVCTTLKLQKELTLSE